MFENDFYPTPAPLIAKMLSGVDFSTVHAILEPSAGKGDICDWIREHKDDRYGGRKTPIDVVEVAPDLQLILKGKGYNLVHDDFLTFRTHKQYSLIVANFPFGQGDRHLQRAIDMVERYGGSLICLVNAETLRNPYTNLRKTIIAALDKYNASIEYLTHEFETAERQTSVEVALVRLDVEYTAQASVILDNLKKSEPVETENRTYSGIVEADFIRSLVRRFNLECRLGIKLIEEYESLKPLMLKRIMKAGEDDRYNDAVIKLTVGNANDYNREYVNEYLREIRYKYWQVLIGDSRFTRNLTSNVTRDLSRKLDSLKDCDFSEFNIMQLQDDLNARLVAGIEQAILDMFDEFTVKYSYHEDFGRNVHYYNGWKSNKAHKVNKKIILPVNGFSSYSYDRDKLDNFYIHEKLGDMVKAFNYLGGELDSAGSVVSRCINVANTSMAFRNLDFHYFTATFFKKGTCHITFKDERLLNKLNIFGGQKRGWLPPSYGKKTYAEMEPEERQVVDEFQGAEEYAEVVTDPQYYIVDTNRMLIGSGELAA